MYSKNGAIELIEKCQKIKIGHPEEKKIDLQIKELKEWFEI